MVNTMNTRSAFHACAAFAVAVVLSSCGRFGESSASAAGGDRIISMKPTLFLTDGNVGPSAVLDQLKKVGVRIDVMLPGNTLDSAQQLLVQLGDKFGRRPAADSVLAQWKAGMQDVWKDTAQYVGKPKPRVLIIHFGQIANNY